jgi:hypothetical protein
LVQKFDSLLESLVADRKHNKQILQNHHKQIIRNHNIMDVFSDIMIEIIRKHRYDEKYIKSLFDLFSGYVMYNSHLDGFSEERCNDVFEPYNTELMIEYLDFYITKIIDKSSYSSFRELEKMFIDFGKLVGLNTFFTQKNIYELVSISKLFIETGRFDNYVDNINIDEDAHAVLIFRDGSSKFFHDTTVKDKPYLELFVHLIYNSVNETVSTKIVFDKYINDNCTESFITRSDFKTLSLYDGMEKVAKTKGLKFKEITEWMAR